MRFVCSINHVSIEIDIRGVVGRVVDCGNWFIHPIHLIGRIWRVQDCYSAIANKHITICEGVFIRVDIPVKVDATEGVFFAVVILPVRLSYDESWELYVGSQAYRFVGISLGEVKNLLRGLKAIWVTIQHRHIFNYAVELHEGIVTKGS